MRFTKSSKEYFHYLIYKITRILVTRIKTFHEDIDALVYKGEMGFNEHEILISLIS